MWPSFSCANSAPMEPSYVAMYRMNGFPVMEAPNTSALARYFFMLSNALRQASSCELPKGLMLGRDENIHIRITALGDVGSHNQPPLGA